MSGFSTARSYGFIEFEGFVKTSLFVIIFLVFGPVPLLINDKFKLVLIIVEKVAGKKCAWELVSIMKCPIASVLGVAPKA